MAVLQAQSLYWGKGRGRVVERLPNTNTLRAIPSTTWFDFVWFLIIFHLSVHAPQQPSEASSHYTRSTDEETVSVRKPGLRATAAS